jgi:hypothetical protein
MNHKLSWLGWLFALALFFFYIDYRRRAIAVARGARRFCLSVRLLYALPAGAAEGMSGGRRHITSLVAVGNDTEFEPVRVSVHMLDMVFAGPDQRASGGGTTGTEQQTFL